MACWRVPSMMVSTSIRQERKSSLTACTAAGIFQKGLQWRCGKAKRNGLHRQDRRVCHLATFCHFPERVRLVLPGGFAKIGVSGKVGYIDHSGEFAIAPRFLDGESFHDGMARVLVEGPCVYNRWPPGHPRNVLASKFLLQRSRPREVTNERRYVRVYRHQRSPCVCL